MTSGPGPPPADGAGPERSRAEQVLSQALRVLAGGGKPPAPTEPDSRSRRRRLTTGQLLLLAAIIGLLTGIAVGFLSLMI